MITIQDLFMYESAVGFYMIGDKIFNNLYPEHHIIIFSCYIVALIHLIYKYFKL